MFAVTTRPQLLLKFAAGAKPRSQRGQLAIGSTNLGLTLEPLNKQVAGSGFSMRRAGRWWLASVDMGSMGMEAPPVNAWDLCHQIVENGGRVGDATIEFAEPDLSQQWMMDDRSAAGLGFGGSDDPHRPNDPQNPAYNTLPDDDWFRDARHSQLDLARQASGNPADDERVRIAHFDTGYDPAHATLPRHMDFNLQRNFVDRDHPNDARDRTDGFFTNVGHGTGTLGILAGKAWGTSGISKHDLGGAPFARVVPVRVANSVVLFRTSAIAQAFEYVNSLANKPSSRIDIVTMSMGGLASQAWAEAINRAYDLGIFIVTAAGNNYANLPTRFLVYPARFNRVVGACGVQARTHGDRLDPYADLKRADLMAGNYGPDSRVDEAMAAFTPNVPWARIHSGDKVDLDGGGTSAATPQIAAAAANWIQKNRKTLAKYPRKWMRVEAVRHALFGSAGSWSGHEAEVRKYYGRGILQTNDALGIAPQQSSALKKAKKDSAWFALIRGIGGLGIAGEQATLFDNMLALEIQQASQSSTALGDAIEDIAQIKEPAKRLNALKEALCEQKGLSKGVRKWLDLNATPTPVPAPTSNPGSDYYARRRIEKAKNPPIDRPTIRRLRVFTTDPSASSSTQTKPLAHTVINLPWRDVAVGPVNEYFEIVDYDPASKAFYAPVDLNNSSLLASDGLTPSESDPRFHQQMVFAVASKTVCHFEEALGRPSLWSARHVRIGNNFHEQFVQRLRIYPHAMREANAYYSPMKKALLFGYFAEAENAPAGIAPGSTVFSCLSYDIIAHETSHALLDGLHRRYAETSNPDSRAFHEAFSDLVALFQHFTHDTALRSSIGRTRPGRESFDANLTGLARQFGLATGMHGALRSALGTNGNGDLMTIQNTSSEAHDRGAVLVAAMFDAFLDIYHRRSADLLRIATQGSGILPDGDMHPDLVNRLAREAAKTAGHLLRMTIRALDYCPPVSITLGEYLRALITSDFDLVPDDPYEYRTAIVFAFRQRGIHPHGVKSISADSLRWYPPEIDEALQDELRRIFRDMDKVVGFRDWKLETERSKAFEISNKAARHLAIELRAFLESRPFGEEEARRLGFTMETRTSEEILGKTRDITRFEVHSVRPARRATTVGQERLDLVVEITQKCKVPGEGGSYRGGATWIVDAETGTIRYIVYKRVSNGQRIQQEHDFRQSLRRGPSFNYYGGPANPSEPFALVHRGHGEDAL